MRLKIFFSLISGVLFTLTCFATPPAEVIASCKESFVSLILIGFVGSNVNAANPIYPAQIIASMPKYVYDAFPYSNGDGRKPLNSMAQLNSISDTNKSSEISINTVTSGELVDMNTQEFFEVVDVANDKITAEGVKNLLKLAQDSSLDVNKRTFFLDKLGFVGAVDMIPNLIELFYELHDDEAQSIKNQIIASTLNIYQRYNMLEEHPNEKELLQKFYMDILGHELLATEKAIAIRGFISLSTNESIISNLAKIISKIDEPKNQISPQTAIKLKMELFNKSTKLEGLVVSDIINMLKNSNNSEAEGIFNAFIVHRLSQLGPNNITEASKNEISAYLDTIKYKYDINNTTVSDDGMTLFSKGAWLEASALIKSNTLNEAAKYVAEYLTGKSFPEQESYVIGLSNSNYMKKAFETEPVLINFKKMNSSIYFDTVGLSTR